MHSADSYTGCKYNEFIVRLILNIYNQPSAVAPSTIHSKRLLDDRSPQADSDDAKEYIGQSVTPGEESRASSRPQSHPLEEASIVDDIQSFDFGFGAKTDNSKANTPDKPTIGELYGTR